MNQDFAELIDQLALEVDRLRKEVARLRAENAQLSATPASKGLFDEISDQDRHALRHQVIEHIRKIDHLLGEDA
jgi:cell division protein FtsB